MRHVLVPAAVAAVWMSSLPHAAAAQEVEAHLFGGRPGFAGIHHHGIRGGLVIGDRVVLHAGATLEWSRQSALPGSAYREGDSDGYTLATDLWVALADPAVGAAVPTFRAELAIGHTALAVQTGHAIEPIEALDVSGTLSVGLRYVPTEHLFVFAETGATLGHQQWDSSLYAFGSSRWVCGVTWSAGVGLRR